MTGGRVHVVGAGIAGLSAATALAEAGRAVVLYEAAKAAGGRCRSYFDPALGLAIDNGNHLLLSGNRDAMAYLRRVGGRDALEGPDQAVFAFLDIPSGLRWQLRPNAGRLPWWVAFPSRRVPGTHLRDYLAPMHLLRADHTATVGSVMPDRGLLWQRLWRPVLLAALNTEPEDSAAGPAAAIIRDTLGAGGYACRPLIATHGLSTAFVDPALGYLLEHRAERRFGARLRAIESVDGRASRLVFTDESVELGAQDQVVLAVPPWVATELLPDISAPDEFRGILNAHFAIAPPAGQPRLLGLIGATAEWLFAYPDRLSVTISAADRLFDIPREEIAARIWAEVAQATGLPRDPMPPWQIVKEKRATFAALPSQETRRPGARTHLSNLVLAGDWVANGLPATIEGAIGSGALAASMLQHDNGMAAASMEQSRS
ncbi:hydroxysqualene dehydroxylase HpnE [Enterovirga rhinocerotis]|uniref:Squalene-associated FAD-dependent desaturase n=1 Tax=Enterovirga rhinocerotis TaxID=1339210 RepID=A0A4V3DZ39_9HYPH|nr:hydroxysqualene dehydroxylase HpnE [Enterovirga rhinocerotis]TDR94479.1 squalene-associated FAD-dependent desaturase [Enterovirga rhinocerotis]